MIGTVTWGKVVLQMTWCEVSRRPILSTDGTTLLYQETSLAVYCVYNPAATCYTTPGANKVPVASNKVFAGATDVSLREYLSQPRQRLYVEYGDHAGANQIFLESPPSGPMGQLVSDAKNGPICEINNITQHDGTKTWQCFLTFKTWVACQDAASPVLAHRFKKTVQIDQDFFTIIVTQGEVTFDVGRLWSANPPQSPDFYRSQFFTAPPGNFARESINVEVSPDNTTCTYTVVDRMRAFNLGTGSPATRVEGFLTTDYQQGTFAAAQADITEAGISTLGQISIDPVHDAALAFGYLGSIYRAYKAQLPKYFVAIKLRAWGAPDSARLDLFDLLSAIAVAKIGPTPAWLTSSNSTQITITQEITGKYVELDMVLRFTDDVLTRLAGNISAAFAQIGLGESINPLVIAGQLTAAFPAANAAVQDIVANLRTNGANFYLPYLMEPEGVLGAGSVIVLTPSPIGNRPPLGLNTTSRDLYVRGPGYLQKLMVGALSGQCQNPPVVGMADSAVTPAPGGTKPPPSPAPPPGEEGDE